MAGRTVDLNDILSPERLAVQIAQTYTEWQTLRAPWVEEKRELRNYIFQTSTHDTTNSVLPWKNSTTTPKICQIRDNLHANYMAALFPNDNWLNWLGGTKEDAVKAKRDVIQNYMINKTEASNFRAHVSQLINDWIDYGQCFATAEYVNEVLTDEETGEQTVQYRGPKLVRLSPLDIVFNPIAASFDNSPKIIRSVKSLGDLKKDLEDHPEKGYFEEIFKIIQDNRKSLLNYSPEDNIKSDGFQVDGFDSYFSYFQSGMVELLDFYGDLYDQETGDLLSNYCITVVDRCHIIRKRTIPGWNKNKIRTVGWRLRPDNLYAMGPLDNLVGMQYRIDHLENLKADVFDLIAHPVIKVKGFVEDFDYGPGEKIICGDDGEVEFMPPDTTALNADMQIKLLEEKMEEFAGAPRQAMGIRTPGEKTALEVQTLENSAGRIFQNKISYFEQMFLEPLLNDMLEVARRNMSGPDTIRALDDEIEVAIFQQVTKEDLKASGKLKPIGARHFATKANMVQNLLGWGNSAFAADPAVNNHISGLGIAKAFEDLLGVRKFELVTPNVRIIEQMESQRLVNAGAEQLQVEQQIPAGVTADEEEL